MKLNILCVAERFLYKINIIIINFLFHSFKFFKHRLRNINLVIKKM
jgi:hypothetical protein